MKLKINNKYEEVDLWSFIKCSLISGLIVSAIYYAFLVLLGLFVVILE